MLRLPSELIFAALAGARRAEVEPRDEEIHEASSALAAMGISLAETDESKLHVSLDVPLFTRTWNSVGPPKMMAALLGAVATRLGMPYQKLGVVMNLVSDEEVRTTLSDYHNPGFVADPEDGWQSVDEILTTCKAQPYPIPALLDVADALAGHGGKENLEHAANMRRLALEWSQTPKEFFGYKRQEQTAGEVSRDEAYRPFGLSEAEVGKPFCDCNNHAEQIERVREVLEAAKGFQTSNPGMAAGLGAAGGILGGGAALGVKHEDLEKLRKMPGFCPAPTQDGSKQAARHMREDLEIAEEQRKLQEALQQARHRGNYTSKFRRCDRVWRMEDNRAVDRLVLTVRIEETFEGKVVVLYGLEPSQALGKIDHVLEENLFGSREELLASL